MSMVQVVVIYLASLVLNWLVQLGYYLYCKRKNPRAFAGQKTLLNYYTGFLGDGIIVPLINVLIFYVMVKIGYWPTINELTGAFSLALLIDFLSHFAQAKWSLTNWSMPRPYHWNFAGYWHMISFPLEVGYLLIFANNVYRNYKVIEIHSESAVRYATVGIFALMLLFVILYAKDNNWI